MITKSIISNHNKDTFDLVERDTLTERMRRARALNARLSDIGIAQYAPRKIISHLKK